MTKLILNDNELELLSFNRNTSLMETVIVSSAFVALSSDAATIAALHELIKTPSISSLIIKKDDEIIYDAGLINASITSINESLTDDGMNLTLNIDFH